MINNFAILFSIVAVFYVAITAGIKARDVQLQVRR